VDIEAGFVPLYVVPADKKAKIRELKAKLKNASVLYLATTRTVRARRFLAPARAARAQGAGQAHGLPRDHEGRDPRSAGRIAATVDTALVDAQEARRILDRLYGYEVSPVLWREDRAAAVGGAGCRASRRA
jgi:DNA topoisomerase-1